MARFYAFHSPRQNFDDCPRLGIGVLKTAGCDLGFRVETSQSELQWRIDAQLKGSTAGMAVLATPLFHQKRLAE